MTLEAVWNDYVDTYIHGMCFVKINSTAATVGGVYDSAMASAKCLVPLDTFRNKFYSDSAGGTRATFILGSIAAPPTEDVVPRQAINLTDEDRRILSNLALPPDRWTDLEVIIAREKYDERVSIEISKPGHELSCEFVLKRLGEFLRSSVDKDGGIYNIILLCIALHNNRSVPCNFIIVVVQLSFTILVMGESFEVTGASKMAI